MFKGKEYSICIYFNTR